MEFDKLVVNKQSLNEKKEILEKELNNLNENKQQIINRKTDINIDNMVDNFHLKRAEYKIVFDNNKALKHIIDNYKTVFNILSEMGIKAYFFKKLIPILNTKVNEYLQLFEIPIVLLFDEFMDEKITEYDNIKNCISYYSYSEGEKKRIDMAILLSFISMTKAISNWNCNLLLIDELLDGAIDETGLEKLVSSLKNMTYDSNLCIYVISHRLQQDYNSKFNKCLQFEKVEGFSKINYI
jgi:DNA repair exonuclease SbcCD ATPase subunit